MTTTGSRPLASPAVKMLIWDNHGCMPLRTNAEFLPQLERYRQAGASVVSINIGYGSMTRMEHMELITYMRAWIADRPERFELVATMADIERCITSDRLGIVFDIEGMSAAEGDPDFVQTFYDLGVRWMLIAYNRSNWAGGGCLDVDHGLTAHGRKIIDEMAHVGMVLCLSHAGERTAREALEYNPNPSIFSHSNPVGCHPHPRNISDALIKECARRGGVVGLSGLSLFLGESENPLDALLDQIFYVADLVGPNHVGLGLDYVFDRQELEEFAQTHPNLFPTGMTNMSMLAPEVYSEIVDGLAARSMSDADISSILGGNWYCIAHSVWR